ncbi:MAG: hypothetical protein P8179_25390, partial [Candidatus Thiodiazotropha sp.]
TKLVVALSGSARESCLINISRFYATIGFSCYDIQILLATTLPSRQNNEQDVLALMEERHRKRQAAIDSSRARQRY